MLDQAISILLWALVLGLPLYLFGRWVIVGPTRPLPSNVLWRRELAERIRLRGGQAELIPIAALEDMISAIEADVRRRKAAGLLQLVDENEVMRVEIDKTAENVVFTLGGTLSQHGPNYDILVKYSVIKR